MGASVYFALSREPALDVSAAACTMVFLAAFWLQRRSAKLKALRLLLVIACGAACGFIAAKIHVSARNAPILTQSIGPVMLEGWVTDVEPGKNGSRLRISVHSVAGVPYDQTPRDIRLTHSNSLEVEPGRFARCWGVVRPPPQPEFPGDYPFNRQAFFEGLDGVGYVLGRCRGGVLGNPKDAMPALSTGIGAWRRSLARHVDGTAGERAGGFAAALASGDRSFMDNADMEALRNSGLAHLLAISGLHLGIVGTLVYLAVKRSLSMWEWFALRVPTQKPAALSAIGATGLYLVISGASISTQRAFIMAAVVFLALLLDRSPLSLRTFSLAMIAVLLLQPASVMTPGFQMSFAATGALIATYEAWWRQRSKQAETRRRGIVFALQSLMITSIVGAAATAPFALYHFDRVAPLGLIANLLAMPIITFISAPSAGLALVAWPFGLSDVFLRLFGWSLERVLAIAHWTASEGDNVLSPGSPMPSVVLVILTLGLVGACLATTVRQRVSVAAVAMIVCAPVWSAGPKPVLHWSTSGDIYVVGEHGIERLRLAEGEGLPPLQYAEVSVTQDCRQTGCVVRTPAGTVILGSQAWLETQCDHVAEVIISADVVPENCGKGAIRLSWQSVKGSGAITLMREMSGSLRIRRPICGHRPWAPCLETREPNQS